MLTKYSILTCAFSFIITLVMIGPAANSVVGDELELEREVAVSEQSDSFHAVSDSTGYNTNDRFDLIFDEGVLNLWYTDNGVGTSAPAWELELAFNQIVEFRDNDNGYFDAGDTVVSTLDLADAAYTLTYATVGLPEGGNKTTITAVHERGVLTLVFVMTTSPIVAGTVPISPSQVKMDVRISGYDLVGGGDHLGLRISVDADSSSSLQYEELDHSSELNLSKSSMGGFFKWSDNATVDGVERPVGSSWSEGTLTISYPAGESIVHDPIIGVRSVAPLSGVLAPASIVGSPLIYGIGIAFASATVLGAVALRSRKNH